MPRRGLTDHDKALWAEYARMVAPLPGRTPVVTPQETTPPASEPSPRPGIARRPPKPRQLAPALTVGTQPGGVDSATWQRFRSGKLQATRRLDLHGMTTQRAFHALLGFVRTAHADQVRCVEIITGRGSGEAGGAIRREFPHWLNRPDIRPLILGAAHPHALNPGSVRLILRRIR